MKISEIRTMLAIMDHFADEMPLNLIKDVEVTNEELVYIKNTHVILRRQKEKLNLRGITKFRY